MAYSSDLSDAEWEIVEPLLLELLPKKKKTRPPKWTNRQIINGILYQLKNGCNWCDLQSIYQLKDTKSLHHSQGSE